MNKLSVADLAAMIYDAWCAEHGEASDVPRMVDVSELLTVNVPAGVVSINLNHAPSHTLSYSGASLLLNRK